MPDRLFALMERLQQLDERLRVSRRTSTTDQLEILRLSIRRRALRDRLSLTLGRGRLPGGMTAAAQAG